MSLQSRKKYLGYTSRFYISTELHTRTFLSAKRTAELFKEYQNDCYCHNVINQSLIEMFPCSFKHSVLSFKLASKGFIM